MPQRQFWTARIPVELRLRYWTDLTKPHGVGSFQVEVYDQAGKRMSLGATSVPTGDPSEFLALCAEACIYQYMYGEIGGAQEVLSDIRRHWDAALGRMVR